MKSFIAVSVSLLALVLKKHASAAGVAVLASHTSGLLLPQDHPPWSEEHYTENKTTADQVSRTSTSV
jgi:hypothetical protein